MQIVPGISSPFAAAAELAIPLTHKTLSTTLVLTTGHDPSLLDFNSLAKMDTLAIVMATRTLDHIVDGLMEAGLPATTPVCIVKRTSFPDQQAFVSTLGAVVEDTDGKKLSPAVLFVGQVAKFAEEAYYDTI